VCKDDDLIVLLLFFKFHLASKAPDISFSNKLYPHCLVLVVSRNGFEHEYVQYLLVSP